MTAKDQCSGQTPEEKADGEKPPVCSQESRPDDGPSLSIRKLRPHFLFNALASIRELALTDPELASDMVYAFAVHLRADIAAASSDDEIPFSLELKSVRAYLDLEKMSLGDKLKVIYDIGPAEFTVPPLSVRHLAENAVRRRFRSLVSSEGTVTLRTEENDHYILIEVIDTGTGFDPQQEKAPDPAAKEPSGGLACLKRRIEKKGGSFTLSSETGAGTTAVIRLKKNRGAENENHCD